MPSLVGLGLAGCDRICVCPFRRAALIIFSPPIVTGVTAHSYGAGKVLAQVVGGAGDARLLLRGVLGTDEEVGCGGC